MDPQQRDLQRWLSIIEKNCETFVMQLRPWHQAPTWIAVSSASMKSTSAVSSSNWCKSHTVSSRSRMTTLVGRPMIYHSKGDLKHPCPHWFKSLHQPPVKKWPNSQKWILLRSNMTLWSVEHVGNNYTLPCIANYITATWPCQTSLTSTGAQGWAARHTFEGLSGMRYNYMYMYVSWGYQHTHTTGALQRPCLPHQAHMCDCACTVIKQWWW